MHFIHYQEHAGSNPEKFFKATLCRSDQLMVGLNCLEPGQVQSIHTHAGQDKFYFVIDGDGTFTVGDETRTCGPGTVVWAPADVPHGVTNDSAGRLSVLVGIAPAP